MGWECGVGRWEKKEGRQTDNLDLPAWSAKPRSKHGHPADIKDCETSTHDHTCTPSLFSFPGTMKCTLSSLKRITQSRASAARERMMPGYVSY